jgi:hypothetical protein
VELTWRVNSPDEKILRGSRYDSPWALLPGSPVHVRGWTGLWGAAVRTLASPSLLALALFAQTQTRAHGRFTGKNLGVAGPCECNSWRALQRAVKDFFRSALYAPLIPFTIGTCYLRRPIFPVSISHVQGLGWPVSPRRRRRRRQPRRHHARTTYRAGRNFCAALTKKSKIECDVTESRGGERDPQHLILVGIEIALAAGDLSLKRATGGNEINSDYRGIVPETRLLLFSASLREWPPRRLADSPTRHFFHMPSFRRAWLFEYFVLKEFLRLSGRAKGTRRGEAAGFIATRTIIYTLLNCVCLLILTKVINLRLPGYFIRGKNKTFNGTSITLINIMS